MPLPVLKTVVGLGLEPAGSYGTPATASAWIPVSGAPKPSDKQAMDEDKAWRGSMGMDYGFQPGIYNTEYGYDSYVFPDTVGWALAGVLGDVTYSGGTNTGTSTTATGPMAAGVTNSFTVASGSGIAAGTVLAIDTGTNQELATCATATTGTSVVLTAPVQLTHTSGVTIQPVTGPFTASMALYNGTTGQPPSYTVTDWYSANGRQYPGCVFSGASFKFAGSGLISYSASLVGLPSVSLNGTKPQASYTSVRPLSGWLGVVQIGGTTVKTVLDLSVDLKRKAAPINPITGQQAPTSIFAADLSVSGKTTLVMNDDSALLDYLNNTQPPIDINYQVGAGSSATQFRLHLNQAAYTATEIDRSKDFVQTSVTFTAVLNSTDAGLSGGYSPLKATLLNNVAPRTYA